MAWNRPTQKIKGEIKTAKMPASGRGLAQD